MRMFYENNRILKILVAEGLPDQVCKNMLFSFCSWLDLTNSASGTLNERTSIIAQSIEEDVVT
jgi:hypothetical protein